MLRKQIVLLAALVLAVVVGACAPAAASRPTDVPPTRPPTLAPTAADVTVRDGLGRTVTLAGPAQRIVSLGPSNTEMLFALGAGSQVIGRDDLSDYPTAASSVAGVGATYGSFSVEAIVAVNPDLVLVSEIYTPEQVQSLADAGLSVYWLPNPTAWEGLYANLAVVGQLTVHFLRVLPAAATAADAAYARAPAVDP